MKNKGFTLVELLAVLILLSIIIIIAVPNVLSALTSSKDSLNKIQKKNVEYAAEKLILEVVNCDVPEDVVVSNIFVAPPAEPSCENMRNFVYDNKVKVTIGGLKEYGYLEDFSAHCEGYVSITTDENSLKIDTDLKDLNCTK